MHLARSRAFRLVMILGAALAAVSCSKDDIPTTPSPPFLTGVTVSKTLSPTGGTTLTKTVAYPARFDVLYTLSPADYARRDSLAVFAGIFSVDVNGHDSLLAALPTNPPLTSISSAVAVSLNFTVPSGASYISVVGVVGFIATDSVLAYFELPSWNVK